MPKANFDHIKEKYNLTPDQEIALAVGEEIANAIYSLKQYQGNLNDFRVNSSDLRNLAVEMMRVEIEDVGLEDLLHSIQTIAKKE